MGIVLNIFRVRIKLKKPVCCEVGTYDCQVPMAMLFYAIDCRLVYFDNLILV